MIDVPPFWRRVARLGGLVVMGVGGLLFASVFFTIFGAFGTLNDLANQGPFSSLGLGSSGGMLNIGGMFDIGGAAMRGFAGVLLLGVGNGLRAWAGPRSSGPYVTTKYRADLTADTDNRTPQVVVKCRDCGQTNAEGANYCQHCGKLL